MIERVLRTVVGARFGALVANHRSSNSATVARAPTAGATFATATRSASSRWARVRLPRTVRVAYRRRPVAGSVPWHTRSSHELAPR
jgi:hypothetical protein